MGIKLGLVYLFGPPALSVILFEIILNGTAMFSHSNLQLPLALDAVLRLLIVTPDMHRVHHSVIIREHNSNFGFNLSLWDRLFGTYRAQPEKGPRGNGHRSGQLPRPVTAQPSPYPDIALHLPAPLTLDLE